MLQSSALNMELAFLATLSERECAVDVQLSSEASGVSGQTIRCEGAISTHLCFVLLKSERPGLKCPLSVHYTMVLVVRKATTGIYGDCVGIVVEEVWQVSCG